MRAIVAFVVGYYLGTRDGQERLAHLARSARDIANSPEFQAVRSSLETLVKQSLGELHEKFTPRPGPAAADIGDVWKAISESAEFRELLATAAAALQSVLSSIAPQDPGDRPASH